MATRKSQTVTIPPTLPPERAYTALKKQIEALQALSGKNYAEAGHEEREWSQFTETIIERAFGNPSTNLSHFHRARSAGNYQLIPYGGAFADEADQQNFEARIAACNAFLKATLSELELIMPAKDIQGQYDAGQEYEFYRDIKAILSSAKAEVMIVDPYLSTDIFDIYADGISKTIHLRILTNNPPDNVLTVARKYASGGNISLRTTNAIHDRLIFINESVWFIGQSIKDAAKKKPTYIVEQDSRLVRQPYEDIWKNAVTTI